MKVRWYDETCNVCGAQLNSWDKRISKTLAYRYPCCEKCVAKEYDMEVDEVRAKFEHIFGLHPCQGI